MDKIIFWDMDGTLGFFDAIADYDKAENVPKDTIELHLKKGIENLLQDLSADGFRHYVTTSASADYTKLALEITGIRKYFDKVFSKKDICENPVYDYAGDKNYNIPLKDIGVTLDKAKSDVLIIGNSHNDVPHNMKEIVSIIDENQWMRSSELTKKMIYMLMDKGEGDFNKGFHKMYENSEKMDPPGENMSQIGKMLIDNDVELHLKFMEDKDKYSRAPIFIVKKADKYNS